MNVVQPIWNNIATDLWEEGIAFTRRDIKAGFLKAIPIYCKESGWTLEELFEDPLDFMTAEEYRNLKQVVEFERIK